MIQLTFAGSGKTIVLARKHIVAIMESKTPNATDVLTVTGVVYCVEESINAISMRWSESR